jgi:hypothetical protein
MHMAFVRMLVRFIGIADLIAAGLRLHLQSQMMNVKGFHKLQFEYDYCIRCQRLLRALLSSQPAFSNSGVSFSCAGKPSNK